MARRVQVRSIKRQELDRDKLALAFLMLAKILAEQDKASQEPSDDREAA